MIIYIRDIYGELIALDLSTINNNGNGKSAYEIAVANGFKGTEQEWLKSLQGLRGETGPKGDKGDRGDQGLQGPPGQNGVIPNISEIENEINNIKAKIDKIEQEDLSVETSIIDNILTLTTNKHQKTVMANNTTIKLPNVNKFTEIHLKFSTTEALTLILPKIKWQSDVSIEANKTYEFIFTYDDEWLGGLIVYNEQETINE